MLKPLDAMANIAVRIALTTLLLLPVVSASGDSPEAYGSKVVFQVNSPIHFPDFDLEYVGSHRETPPQYPRGWLVYDFRIVRSGETLLVSWSGGTGVIAPSYFVVAGKHFLLELKYSERLGHLKDNELLVSKAPSTT